MLKIAAEAVASVASKVAIRLTPKVNILIINVLFINVLFIN